MQQRLYIIHFINNSLNVICNLLRFYSLFYFILLFFKSNLIMLYYNYMQGFIIYRLQPVDLIIFYV
ncbi:hypothetical protein MCHI_001566 [Candidatus Magnetoovum chiemensis]|nr:hypothetical protein MCHI_001566 [Candidatus Magnetoovum chiemensis]